MRGDQRRVEVDDQRPRRPGRQRECSRPRLRASGPQRVEQPDLGDVIDDPPRRRIGRHHPEQAALVAQRPQVAQGVAAIGEHHRQIPDHATRIMPGPPPPEPTQPGR
jgi:hypothetical protein